MFMQKPFLDFEFQKFGPNFHAWEMWKKMLPLWRVVGTLLCFCFSPLWFWMNSFISLHYWIVDIFTISFLSKCFLVVYLLLLLFSVHVTYFHYTLVLFTCIVLLWTWCLCLYSNNANEWKEVNDVKSLYLPTMTM